MSARLSINGEPARIDDLRVPIATNYGHFTSMRIERGCVRGLDLHLHRLDASTRLLFDHPLDVDAVRRWLRDAVAGDESALSARIAAVTTVLVLDSHRHSTPPVATAPRWSGSVDPAHCAIAGR